MDSTNSIKVGDRVRRVRGTSIEGLVGIVLSIDPALSPKREKLALVRLEGPGEPGIGHQFACPVGDLAVLPEMDPASSNPLEASIARARVEGDRLVIPGFGSRPRSRPHRHIWQVSQGRTYCQICQKPHPTEGGGVA